MYIYNPSRSIIDKLKNIEPINIPDISDISDESIDQFIKNGPSYINTVNGIQVYLPEIYGLPEKIITPLDHIVDRIADIGLGVIVYIVDSKTTYKSFYQDLRDISNHLSKDSDVIIYLSDYPRFVLYEIKFIGRIYRNIKTLTFSLAKVYMLKWLIYIKSITLRNLPNLNYICFKIPPKIQSRYEILNLSVYQCPNFDLSNMRHMLINFADINGLRNMRSKPCLLNINSIILKNSIIDILSANNIYAYNSCINLIRNNIGDLTLTDCNVTKRETEKPNIIDIEDIAIYNRKNLDCDLFKDMISIYNECASITTPTGKAEYLVDINKACLYHTKTVVILVGNITCESDEYFDIDPILRTIHKAKNIILCLSENVKKISISGSCGNNYAVESIHIISNSPDKKGIIIQNLPKLSIIKINSRGENEIILSNLPSHDGKII